MHRSSKEAVSRITADVLDTYRRDGVVMMSQLLHPEWLALIELGLQRVMANSAQVKHRFFDDQPGEFLETVRNFDVTPEIRRLLFDSPIADVLGALVGSERMWYYSDEFFIKEGGNRSRTPWHQDTTYWPLAGTQIASMWISLDPLSKDECLEYVAGSHHGSMFDGFNPRVVGTDPSAPYYGSLPPLPDIQANRDAFNIVSWPIVPGDVILANPGVLHGGGGTGPTTRRRAITVRCYGDDIVFALRPSTKPTAPRTPGLSLQLQPGEPLRSPWYPQVRPVPPWERAT
jgi:ectoine hydroxylase-related dioxygenase (phytanoyl-CoA dioxygenase family)